MTKDQLESLYTGRESVLWDAPRPLKKVKHTSLYTSIHACVCVYVRESQREGGKDQRQSREHRESKRDRDKLERKRQTQGTSHRKKRLM